MRMTTAQRDIEDYRALESLVLDGTEVTAVPRGRSTGLWGAFALVAAPGRCDRGLPATDTATLGLHETMFDYDEALAVDLDVALG